MNATSALPALDDRRRRFTANRFTTTRLVAVAVLAATLVAGAAATGIARASDPDTPAGAQSSATGASSLIGSNDCAFWC